MDSSLDLLYGKIAVVTGASSGIGKAISETLVSRGLRVVGLARRQEELQELAKQLENKNGKFFSLQTDITKEENVLHAFKWVKENLGPVHVLINSAGVIRPKGLIDGDAVAWKEVLDTNVLGLCIASREAVKDMQENKTAGYIIHINCGVGHIVLPGVPSLYSASKWAVTALTETLRQELNSVGSKIKVTSLSPGPVKTEIIAAGGFVLNEESKKASKDRPHLNPEDVADSVVYILSTPSHVQVEELIIKPFAK